MLKHIERDRAIAIAILGGESLRDVSQQHNLSQERCRQIVFKMAAYIRRDRQNDYSFSPDLGELRKAKGLIRTIKRFNYAKARPLNVDSIRYR